MFYWIQKEGVEWKERTHDISKKLWIFSKTKRDNLLQSVEKCWEIKFNRV